MVQVVTVTGSEGTERLGAFFSAGILLAFFDLCFAEAVEFSRLQLYSSSKRALGAFFSLSSFSELHHTTTAKSGFIKKKHSEVLSEQFLSLPLCSEDKPPWPTSRDRHLPILLEGRNIGNLGASRTGPLVTRHHRQSALLQCVHIVERVHSQEEDTSFFFRSLFGNGSSSSVQATIHCGMAADGIH